MSKNSIGLLMLGKRPKNIVSYNMSRIRSEGTKLEGQLENILQSLPWELVKHPKVYGKPDFAYLSFKIAIFADSDFWHGFDWARKKEEIKTNKEFWLKKIERNIMRDKEVTTKLQEEGWIVVRLWGHDILRNPNKCIVIIKEAVDMAKATSGLALR
jgi:DNA mismatch endonuclease (patch repair protein)